MAAREIHGFTTWVKKVSAEPFPYLHLGYPRDIERVPIRKEERVSADLPAKYQSVTEAKEADEARIVNLSAVGRNMKSDDRPSLGAPRKLYGLQFPIWRKRTGCSSRGLCTSGSSSSLSEG